MKKVENKVTQLKAEVNNVIDLKLNQNDLVELIMDEQREKLEAEVLLADDLFTKAEKKHDLLKAEVVRSLSKLSSFKESDVKALKKLFPKAKFELVFDLQWYNEDLEANHPGDAMHYDVQRHRDYVETRSSRIPVERLWSKAFVTRQYPYSAYVYIKNGDNYRVVTEEIRGIKEEVYKNNPAFMAFKAHCRVEFDARIRKNKADMDLFFFEKQGARTKTKMVREILSKSSEGADVLNMISKVGFDARKALGTGK